MKKETFNNLNKKATYVAQGFMSFIFVLLGCTIVALCALIIGLIPLAGVLYLLHKLALCIMGG